MSAPITPRDVLARPTDAQIRAAAEARVRQAMRHIENAQNELSRACGELSAITHGIPIWNACSKLTDKVHAFWYRVQSFSHNRRYSLDETNVEGLARRLAMQPAVRPQAPAPVRRGSDRMFGGEVEGCGGDAEFDRTR